MALTRLRALLLGCVLIAAARCGGQPPPQPRASMDLDGMSEGTAPKRRKAAPPKAVDLGQIAILSLEGIAMPPTAVEASGSPGAGSTEAKEGTTPAVGATQPASVPGKGPAGKIPARNQTAKAPPPPPPVAAVAPDAPPPRNLFAFEEDPKVVMARRQQAEEAATQAEEFRRKAEQARLKWQGPPLPPPPPKPPAISFQFIGYMGKPEDRIGVFAGPGTFLAKNGEVVQGKFKILSIGYESAEIGFTGFSETQRIPLTPGGK